MIDGRRGQDPAGAGRGSGSAKGGARAGRLSRLGAAVGRGVARLHITADQVTVAGVVFSSLTAVAIGAGRLDLGVGLLVVGGLMDTLDGLVATASSSSSKRGAFFDSVADRVSDALVFGGVAWYLAGGHDPRLAIIPLAILGLSAVVSYERAKAESLGFHARGGIMERAERLILLGVALVFSVVLVPLLLVLLGLVVITAVQRFATVWAQAASASPAEKSPPALSTTWRRGRVDSRWRSWREDRRGQTARIGSFRSLRPSDRRSLEPLSTRLRRVIAAQASTVGARSGGQRRERARTPRTAGSRQTRYGRSGGGRERGGRRVGGRAARVPPRSER